VLRGGSWSHDSLNARAAIRYGIYPSSRLYSYGFRLVRTP
jgi:formylglycine-generating enzyme required for sulfatase activity